MHVINSDLEKMEMYPILFLFHVEISENSTYYVCVTHSQCLCLGKFHDSHVGKILAHIGANDLNHPDHAGKT